MPTRALFPDGSRAPVRALCLGQRIDTRPLEHAGALGRGPLLVPVGSGVAAVFRFGVVVLFGVSPEDEGVFVSGLALTGPFEVPEVESLEIAIAGDGKDAVGQEEVQLCEATVPRLQVVADVLAKTVVLAHHEGAVAGTFDRIEPLAAELEHHGRVSRSQAELLRYIGGALAVQTQTIARVEVTERPELLWDEPSLEPLHAKLRDEYDLDDRQRALERKLGLVASTAETLVDLLQTRQSLRVEWYIVALIVVEIALTLYGMATGG